jgi:hypothetical protein
MLEGYNSLSAIDALRRCKAGYPASTRRMGKVGEYILSLGAAVFLYGPGQPHSFLTPSITTSLLKGAQAICSHGDLVGDYIYVEDAAVALTSPLEGEVNGSVNVASAVDRRSLKQKI